MRTKFNLFVLAVALLPFTLRSQESVFPTVTPKHLQLEFSRGAVTKGRTDYVYSTANRRLYVLSLEPQFDSANHTVGVDLVLRDFGKPRTDENLLNPPGNWHGLQPYNFVARDLLRGPDKSVFGAHRSIEVMSRGLRIGILVKSVQVAAQPDGTNELDKLKLSLAVENLLR